MLLRQLAYISLRHGGVGEGNKVGRDPVTPPQLPRDTPWTRVLQPAVPRPVMELGNQPHLTTTNSLGMEIKYIKPRTTRNKHTICVHVAKITYLSSYKLVLHHKTSNNVAMLKKWNKTKII